VITGVTKFILASFTSKVACFFSAGNKLCYSKCDEILLAIIRINIVFVVDK
jgi:hypothetical protein